LPVPSAANSTKHLDKKESAMLTRLFVALASFALSMILPAASGYAQQATDIGKQEFTTSCAVCHGDDGKGEGSLMKYFDRRAADLTVIQKNNTGVFPFDRIYEVIDGRQTVAAHGPREMPVWGDVYSSRAGTSGFEYASPKDLESYVRGRIIALIGYIYTLQKK
jgi:mono/diheme cytochrome c family protein